MADNVQLPATAGNFTAAGDERTIGGSTVLVQRIVGIGTTAFAATQVVATTSPTQLVAARDTRYRVVIRNDSNVDIWVGPPTVTTANARIPVGESLELYVTGVVQAIIASGTMTGNVICIEEYD